MAPYNEGSFTCDMEICTSAPRFEHLRLPYIILIKEYMPTRKISAISVNFWNRTCDYISTGTGSSVIWKESCGIGIKSCVNLSRESTQKLLNPFQLTFII